MFGGITYQVLPGHCQVDESFLDSKLVLYSGVKFQTIAIAAQVHMHQHWRRKVQKWWGQLNFEPVFRYLQNCDN